MKCFSLTEFQQQRVSAVKITGKSLLSALIVPSSLALAACDQNVKQAESSKPAEEVGASDLADTESSEGEVVANLVSATPMNEAQIKEKIASLELDAAKVEQNEQDKIAMRVLWDGIPIRLSAWQLNRLIQAGGFEVEWISGCPPTYAYC